MSTSDQFEENIARWIRSCRSQAGDRKHDSRAASESAHIADALGQEPLRQRRGGAIRQPTDAWLRLALVDLHKGIEAIRPDAAYSDINRHLDMVTLEELIVTVEDLLDGLPPTKS